MAKVIITTFEQIGRHPWASLSAAPYIGDDDYIRDIIKRFNPNDKKEIQWMLDEQILSQARLKKIIGSMIQEIVGIANSRAKVLTDALENILNQFVPAGKEFASGEEEQYFRFTIVPQEGKILAFIQGEEKYGAAILHGEGESELEALKDLVGNLKILAPLKQLSPAN